VIISSWLNIGRPAHAPGKGVCGGAKKIFWLRLTTASAQASPLSVFSFCFFVSKITQQLFNPISQNSVELERWRCYHYICRVYFITMYLVAVYVPVSLTCYVCRRINLILAHIVSALPRLLYGTHFLQTFVHVHYMALLSVSWKPILIML